jgi:prepilin-type N-terminal cleavage/methylation domain-containing protein
MSLLLLISDIHTFLGLLFILAFYVQTLLTDILMHTQIEFFYTSLEFKFIIKENPMRTKTLTMRKQLKKEEGFTLVEVIAVLVILGILAAVAIPKFFDMQRTAREKAIQGAISELNGQVALSFAKNALDGGTAGGYSGYSAYIGEDFEVYQGSTLALSTGNVTAPSFGKIVFKATPVHWWGIDWKDGPVDGTSPGFFVFGGYQVDGSAL